MLATRGRAAIRDAVAALFGRRRKRRTRANRDVCDRLRHRRGQCLQSFARTLRGRLAHALDERNCIGQWNFPRPWAVDVAADRPGSFVVIGVRRQSVREIDAAAVEELAVGCDSDEDGRVAVLGDADGGCIMRLHCRRHVGLLDVV